MRHYLYVDDGRDTATLYSESDDSHSILSLRDPDGEPDGVVGLLDRVPAEAREISEAEADRVTELYYLLHESAQLAATALAESCIDSYRDQNDGAAPAGEWVEGMATSGMSYKDTLTVDLVPSKISAACWLDIVETLAKRIWDEARD
ncbi:MAG: hypothetical protein NT069_21100 [Planctomycetota bacterium]|nr:hypothetical protein [Planctomycetota bacterium]